MRGKWTVEKSQHYEHTFLILAFLLEEYCKIFGSDVMLNEDCIIYNDSQADCPMLITSLIPIRIRLAQDDLAFWPQTVYQLSHEMCHYAMRQHKTNKNLTLSWFEEIVCEAVSLYALEYASKEWQRCPLSKVAPLYIQTHQSYLEGQLAKNFTDEFKKCNTVEKLRAYELQELPENRRETHRLERNIVYRAISNNPLELKCVLEYTKYIESNGVTIDFDRWIQDNPCNLLKKIYEIYPIKTEH